MCTQITEVIHCIRSYDLIPSSILIMKNFFIYKFNPPLDWINIRDLVKNKSGVYVFVNNVNGRMYVGSAVCLYSRLRDYYQEWYQNRTNTLIVRAMKHHGISNFTIGILELTDKLGAVEAEQKWIDAIKPEYNILKKAGSSLGYTHKAEDIQKISDAMKGKPRSEVTRMDMSARQMGSGNTFFGKTHSAEAKATLREVALNRTSDPRPGFAVEVLDLFTKEIKSYKSIRAVAKEFGCGIGTVTKFNGKLYRDRYVITIHK